VGSGRIVAAASNNTVTYSSQGSAYIYDLDGTNEIRITASDGFANENFGTAVAVGSGRIVVSAAYDADAGSQSGSAYIYDLDGTNEIKITASDAAASDRFGQSVAVGCGRIVVGAPFDDDNGSSSGSAYIFDLDGNQLTKITASDGTSSDQFGWSVAVGSGRIVVGAYGDAGGTGSTYIFDLDGNQLTKITASDGTSSDQFGVSVAVGCGRIVVGASGDDVGSNNDQGSAYIFDLNGNQLAKITASDGAGGDFFGGSVAVGSGRIVVGASGHDDPVLSTGAAYIFDLDGNQLSKKTGTSGADFFGRSVAVGSGRIVVGANGVDSAGASSGGAIYIYDTPKQIHYLDQLDGR
jgi:hypothetical protein